MKRSPKSVQKEIIVKTDQFTLGERLSDKRIKNYFSSYKIKRIKENLELNSKIIQERQKTGKYRV